MRLRFTKRAAADLAAIARYLGARSSQGTAKVRPEIRYSVKMLTTFPESGRLQQVAHVRKLVTPKYGCLIYDKADRSTGTIMVLTICHPNRERPYEDA